MKNVVMRTTPWSATASRGSTQGQRLGFKVRLIGHSHAPITPQQVGSWWMEPIGPRTQLPPRAEHRLRALLASGIKPKAVVLFHETSVAPRRRRSQVETTVARAVKWTQQELPVLAEEGFAAAERGTSQGVAEIRRFAPPLGRLFWRWAIVLGPIMAVGLLAVLKATATTAAVVGTALVTDPCLVLVTQDGYWIEVDRWDE